MILSPPSGGRAGGLRARGHFGGGEQGVRFSLIPGGAGSRFLCCTIDRRDMAAEGRFCPLVYSGTKEDVIIVVWRSRRAASALGQAVLGCGQKGLWPKTPVSLSPLLIPSQPHTLFRG